MEHSKENNNKEQSFSEMLDEYDVHAVDSSSPVEGQIVDFVDDKVIVDIGSKTEGMVPLKELQNSSGEMKYRKGDVISVIYKRKNLKEGYILVSKKEAEKIEGWENIQEAFEKDLKIIGRIVDTVPNNKGFMVDFGVRMFLPMSHLEIRKVSNVEPYIGKEYWFKVLKLDSKKRGGVVSRRKVLEEEQRKKIKKLLNELKEGEDVKGTVASILDYGVFVDIGGINGFLHRNDISYGHIGHPREKFRKGDEIKVKILGINEKAGKVNLGFKQRFSDPWEDIEEKYPVGKRLKARVTKIMNFGAFIELEEGVEGLLHISDLTWEGKPKTVEEYVAVGDRLWVQVIDLDPEEKKIKLGLKQLELRPEEKYIEAHEKGDVVDGVVKKVLKSVVFVGLEDNVEGIIKISDIKYFRIDTPADYLREGEKIQAMILSKELDKNYKVRLGLKQLGDDVWKTFFRENKPGSTVKVTVKDILDSGVKVQITEDIEGFVRIGEITKRRLESEEIKDEVTVGEEREALVVNTSPDRKRINLSFKGLLDKREREDIEKYMKDDTEKPVQTIGDLLQTEIDKKTK